MGKTGFSLVLALALVILSSSSERKCILSGSWQNELGSNMTISAMSADGQFFGQYFTAVSTTPKPIRKSPLMGFQHLNLEQPTFGFTINWTFSELLCQEDENLTEGKKCIEEERLSKETKSRPGLTPGQQRQTAKGQCILTGLWRNELGSEMKIDKMNRDGSFSGKYYMAVSLTEHSIKPSPIIGSQQFSEDGESTFGFTVNWKSFSDSTTVFTGQCYVGENGKEILRTMWLLREKADPQNDWGATRVGTNVFNRIDKQNSNKSLKTNM